MFHTNLKGGKVDKIGKVGNAGKVGKVGKVLGIDSSPHSGT
jgi:hypothetical protein